MYVGRCVGGPMDGERLASSASLFRKTIAPPVLAIPPGQSEVTATTNVCCGCYHHRRPSITPEYWASIPDNEKQDFLSRVCLWVWEPPN
jgi:hypothetical protein